MESNEIFEKFHFTPKLDEDLLKHTTEDYWRFWLKTFGKPKKNTDEEEYWTRCGFVLVGWLGSAQHIKDLEHSMNKNANIVIPKKEIIT